MWSNKGITVYKGQLSWFVLALMASFLMLSGGCASPQPAFVAAPTPTRHPLLTGSEQAIIDLSGSAAQANHPTLSGLFLPRPTSTPRPTYTPRPTLDTSSLALPAGSEELQKEISVFDDKLNPNWRIFEPSQMRYDLRGTESYSGTNAIEVESRMDYSILLFAVRKDAQESYPRDQVLELRFMLYSGDEYIETDDLAVTILGSNSYPYYVDNDKSVINEYQPLFSETRLYYLGINHDIPPNTWAEVSLRLVDRIYDPNYRYVTGFYIKSDAGFRQTFWIDDIKLIVVELE